ncbi:MAG: universal stress protein [Actinobacteria bacterium]|nr:universal stress protein [Actinomycetota bacterium]
MIKSLLVPVDSSKYARSALEHALDLAQTYEARITGLYVLDIRFLEMPPYLELSDTFEHIPSTIVPLDMLERYREKSERVLDRFRERLEKAGLFAEGITEEGVPSQVIADVGKSHDLIVMGKRGEHAKWGRDLLGSTAESVVRRSGTPVLLAETAPHRIETMFVMFDGSVPATRALKLAADLAVHLSAKLKVFTADDDPERGENIRREASSYLRGLEVRATYELQTGSASKAAIALLQEHPADLVVAGMRGHSALHDLILGSTAEHVMRSVPLPVLLVP